jgi:hypothetical protein
LQPSTVAVVLLVADTWAAFAAVEPSMLGLLTMASQAGTVVSLTADEGAFAARSNLKRVYAPFLLLTT